MRRTLLCLLLPFFLLTLSGCGLLQPAIQPDPGLFGCYRLETNLPASYGDTLGYELPDLIRLSDRLSRTNDILDALMVFPTDREFHPSWTIQDGLPSSQARLTMAERSAPTSQLDSLRMVPGDSIDISFPSAYGTLVLRLGPDGVKLGGRAEWVIGRRLSYMMEGIRATASPESCRELLPALKRTRYR